MTIDHKDLEVGDTIELRNGGKNVVDKLDDRNDVLLITTEFCTDSWQLDGRWLNGANHPFDIIAIHKKPKPIEQVVMMGNHMIDPAFNWAKIKLTKQPTGEVTAEVVK